MDKVAAFLKGIFGKTATIDAPIITNANVIKRTVHDDTHAWIVNINGEDYYISLNKVKT